MTKALNWILAPAGQYHPSNVKQLARMDKLLGRRPVPASVGLQASAMLAEHARKLALQYRIDYRQAIDEALRERPALRLGLRPILPDDDFGDVVALVEATDAHDDE